MRKNGRWRAVVFDLDDTLVDSKKDYPIFKRCVLAELRNKGVEESFLDPNDSVLANIRKGKQYLSKQSEHFNGDELERDINIILNRIEMANIDQVKAFPGAQQALEYVIDLGLTVAVLTRASRTYTERALAITSLDDKVTTCVCRDDYPLEEAKPNPQSMRRVAAKISVPPASCIVMGDHPMDRECAKACGAEFVGVLTGSTDHAEWNSQGCELVIDSVANAPEVLAKLMARRNEPFKRQFHTVPKG